MCVGGLFMCILFADWLPWIVPWQENLKFLQVLSGRFSPGMMSDSTCPVISCATPSSHDLGVWQLCGVVRLPVPKLMGENLMGVFSLLALHSSLVLLEWGLATWATPKPPNINLDIKEWNYLPGKRGSQITLQNAALDPSQAVGFLFECVCVCVCVCALNLNMHFYYFSQTEFLGVFSKYSRNETQDIGNISINSKL